MVTDYGVRRDDVAGYSGMARRSIFIVDREGVIRWTWIASREQPQPDYDAVIGEAKKVAAEA
jgi:peroxiredoxin